MKFPKQIYVRIEEDGDSSFLLANETAEEFATAGEEIRAGLYQLVEEVVVTSSITVTIDKADA